MAPAYGIPAQLPKSTISSPNVRSYGLLAVLGIAALAIIVALVIILR